MRSCRGPRCSDRTEKFYCPDHWDALTEELCDRVDVIAEDAERFYIGRSNYPELRLLMHRYERDATRMAILHWASCASEAAALESFVIREFLDDRRLENETDESKGSWYGHWNCVYAVWSPRRRGADERKFLRVDDLDRGRCIVPTRDGAMLPVFLETRLGREAAKRAVEAYDDEHERLKERYRR